MTPESLPRRRFLTLAGGTAGALALGACSWSDARWESILLHMSVSTMPGASALTVIP